MLFFLFLYRVGVDLSHYLFPSPLLFFFFFLSLSFPFPYFFFSENTLPLHTRRGLYKLRNERSREHCVSIIIVDT